MIRITKTIQYDDHGDQFVDENTSYYLKPQYIEYVEVVKRRPNDDYVVKVCMFSGKYIEALFNNEIEMLSFVESVASK